MEADIDQKPSSPESYPLEPKLTAPGMSGLSQEPQISKEQRRTMIFIILLVVIMLLAVVGSIVFLMSQPTSEVARIRDIFIIFMAVQSVLTGLALVVLLVQLARLINLLQNEIKPILDSTNETVSNLRGTTAFLSDNLVGPVIKLNEYLAGFSQLLHVVGLMKRSSQTRTPKGE